MRHYLQPTYTNIFVLACSWKRFDSIVEDEGNPVLDIDNRFPFKTLEECKQICDEYLNEGCQSFGYCPKWEGGSCILFDKELTGIEPQTSRTNCYTNYRNCHGNNLNN